MMAEMTPRLSLPLLQAGQAQKEALHNEAITMLDAVTCGLIESIGDNAPPPCPAPGQAWIVGRAPIGEWTGHAQSVAVRTAGGWRFAPPREGMSFRLRTSGVRIERTASDWSDGSLEIAKLTIDGQQVVGPRLSGITSPSGGVTIDTEARTAIDAIIVALKTHGLIAF